MKHTSLIALFAIILTFLSCQREESDTSEVSQANSQIVIIFKGMPPGNNYFNKQNGGKVKFMESDVVYFLTTGIEKKFTSDIDSPNDTLEVAIESDYLELKHALPRGEIFTYFIPKGDTVVFSYSNGLPFAESLKSKNSISLNVDKIAYDSVYSGERTIKNRLIPFFDENYPAISPGYLKKKYIDLYRDLDEVTKKTEFLLNELFHQGKINKTIRDIYLKKAFYDEEIVKIEIKRFLQNTNQDEAFIKLALSQNDSLLKYDFYQKYLLTYLNYEFLDVDLARRPQILFDSILSSARFSKVVKQVLLFHVMEDLINSSLSGNHIPAYFEKLKQFSQDSSYILHLDEKYALSKPVSKRAKLIDMDRRKLSLTDLLSQNKGKIIYVDFWASWCAPCRKVMPASVKLRSLYRGKDIEFVYLSIDDNIEKWLKAVKEEGMNNYPNCFLATNRYTSEFLEDLKLTSIPRYIIFDKNGKLIDKNAPGPETSKIKDLLDQYLSQ